MQPLPSPFQAGSIAPRRAAAGPLAVLPVGRRASAPARRCRAAGSDQEQVVGNANTCNACGIDLAKKPFGCDGEGRVVGGLGAVPGMGWWPIKAYRPCPALSQAGKEYVRKGQATNEMLFGGVSLGQSGAQSLETMKEQADKGIKIE